MAHRGRPTVILAQTKKGYGMGHWGQGKMGAHQQKKLEAEALYAFRDRFALPLSDADVDAVVKASVVIGTIGWSIWRKVKRAQHA